MASYSAGLETLLNIPIKRMMLQSPSTAVMQEVQFYTPKASTQLFLYLLSWLLIFFCVYQVSLLHARYLELLTRSSDYCKHLGDSLKNLEQLKVYKT